MDKVKFKLAMLKYIFKYLSSFPPNYHNNEHLKTIRLNFAERHLEVVEGALIDNQRIIIIYSQLSITWTTPKLSKGPLNQNK